MKSFGTLLVFLANLAVLVTARPTYTTSSASLVPTNSEISRTSLGRPTWLFPFPSNSTISNPTMTHGPGPIWPTNSTSSVTWGLRPNSTRSWPTFGPNPPKPTYTGTLTASVDLSSSSSETSSFSIIPITDSLTSSETSSSWINPITDSLTSSETSSSWINPITDSLTNSETPSSWINPITSNSTSSWSATIDLITSSIRSGSLIPGPSNPTSSSPTVVAARSPQVTPPPEKLKFGKFRSDKDVFYEIWLDAETGACQRHAVPKDADDVEVKPLFWCEFYEKPSEAGCEGEKLRVEGFAYNIDITKYRGMDWKCDKQKAPGCPFAPNETVVEDNDSRSWVGSWKIAPSDRYCPSIHVELDACQKHEDNIGVPPSAMFVDIFDGYWCEFWPTFMTSAAKDGCAPPPHSSTKRVQGPAFNVNITEYHRDFKCGRTT